MDGVDVLLLRLLVPTLFRHPSPAEKQPRVVRRRPRRLTAARKQDKVGPKGGAERHRSEPRVGSRLSCVHRYVRATLAVA